MKRQFVTILSLLWLWLLPAQQAFQPAVQAAEAGAYTTAIDLLRTYISANPGRRYEDAHAWWLISQYELALGDAAAAEAANDESQQLRALILSDEIAENYVLAARINLSRGQYARALQALDAAAYLPIEDYRLLASLYQYRGLALAGTQAWEEADQYFRYARETLQLVAGDASPELAVYYNEQLQLWPCAAADVRQSLYAAALAILQQAGDPPLQRARLLAAAAACAAAPAPYYKEAVAAISSAARAPLAEQARLRLRYAQVTADTAVALAQLDTALQLLQLPAAAGQYGIVDRPLLAELLHVQAELLSRQSGPEQLRAALAAASRGLEVAIDNHRLGLSPAADDRDYAAAGVAAAARLQTLTGDKSLQAEALLLALRAQAVKGAAAPGADLLKAERQQGLTPQVLAVKGAAASGAALLKAERQWTLTPQAPAAQAAAQAAHSAWAATVSTAAEPAVDLAALRARLEKNQLLIAYYAGSDELYAFALSAQALEMAVLPGVDQLAAPAEAGEYYEQLLRPFHHLLKGRQPVLLLPAGALQALPWAAIVRTGPRTQPAVLVSDWQRWLLESN